MPELRAVTQEFSSGAVPAAFAQERVSCLGGALVDAGSGPEHAQALHKEKQTG